MLAYQAGANITFFNAAFTIGNAVAWTATRTARVVENSHSVRKLGNLRIVPIKCAQLVFKWNLDAPPVYQRICIRIIFQKNLHRVLLTEIHGLGLLLRQAF